MYFDSIACGKRIQKLRKANFLSQRQFASELNINEKSVSYIENGKRAPSIDLLVQIGVTFDISLDYLITGKEPELLQHLQVENEAAIAHLQKLKQLLDSAT